VTGLAAVLVAVAGATVHARVGGPAVLTVEPGTALEDTGPARGGWVPVRATGTVDVRGFIKTASLGCRMTKDVTIGDVTLRRGAIVRLETKRGKTRAVALGPPAVAVEIGADEAASCAPDGPAYWDRAPTEGDLRTLRIETLVRPAPDGEDAVATAPDASRFVVLQVVGDDARGYVDGPIVVRGWVPVAAIGPPPEGSPLDILTRPLGHTHEVLDATDLWGAPGAPTSTEGPRRARPKARLVGGAPVAIVETREGWLQVRTIGALVVQGWVPATFVREVTISEEAIRLERGARRHDPPARGPRGGR
jgi:hypothetical protein